MEPPPRSRVYTTFPFPFFRDSSTAGSILFLSIFNWFTSSTLLTRSFLYRTRFRTLSLTGFVSPLRFI